MSQTDETMPSPMPELPERLMAFNKLAATEQVFREKYKEEIGRAVDRNSMRKDKGLYIQFDIKDGPIKVSGLSIPGADAVDLVGIKYPDSSINENSDPLIHLYFCAFSEDGSYIDVSGEVQKNDVMSMGCIAFFGAEMPPIMVGSKDYYAALDGSTLPDGSVVRNTPSETILRLDNKCLLTDVDCELFTGLVEANIDSTWFI